ncbi:terpene cyclase [Steccherinum ochraceum]|uniref:Terpene cyclase n=1 Tax=Steccherinum ochraceum TaxID=92696 RepID=A0A4R0RPD9_9APHY|nr:terpene cyclase [Steccherinum ochraceum]
MASVASKEQNHFSESVRQILLGLFQRTGIDQRFRYSGIDPTMEKQFYDEAYNWNLGLTDKQLRKYGTLGLNMAITAYRHTPPEVQLAIAQYTFLGILIDEDIMSTSVIREFPPRLFDGRPQLHPILTQFGETLAKMREQFAPYASTVITTNSAEFVAAEMLVRDEGGPSADRLLGSKYADYIRLKSGLGDTYAANVWPRAMFPKTKTYVQTFPYIAEYACYGNDFYSFYKESAAGETENYVSLLAAANDESTLETMEKIAARLSDIDNLVKESLGDGSHRAAWESFTAGYAEFHLHAPRYRLRELIPEYYL